MRSMMVLMTAGLFAFGAHAQVWYVNEANTGDSPDGTSWATAFSTVQEGIDAAEAGGGGEVWVAVGTYGEARTSIPDGIGWNTGSILMKDGVDVYGGFTGVETAREQRDWEANETILDGSTARDGNPAYHVVVGTDASTLDGFTVTGGVARRVTDKKNELGFGGGMFGGAATNCSFEGNLAWSGGGMYGGAVRDCIFLNNTATAFGGGMSNGSATNCTFTGNAAEDGGGLGSGTAMNCTLAGNKGRLGGGMNGGTATNCVFMDNTAHWGAGIYWGTAVHCTFTGNTADLGGGIHVGTATNCVFWGNGAYEAYHADVTYSLLGSATDGAGNLTGAPRFVNPWSGDFRLRSESLGIDAGTPEGIPDVDALGRARLQGASVDMGAYEHVAEDDQDVVDSINVLRVDVASTALEPDGLTWATAYPTLQQAADRAGFGMELWVARGVYTSEQENVVILRLGTLLYGGFMGTESSRDERSLDNRLTVIDGQGARRGVHADAASCVDGVTITNGSALAGGGMRGGKANNCLFCSNKARWAGGGMCFGSATNCIFVSNTSAEFGGGIREGSAVNCTFIDNLAKVDGGGVYEGSSTNCIIWGNGPNEISKVTVTYSLLSIPMEGEGNIAGSPRFVNPWEDDFRLCRGSQGIDAGLENIAPPTDALGRSRPQGAGVDVGAYEHVAEDERDVVAPVPVLRVDAASVAREPDGLTWQTAYQTLQEAVERAAYGTEVWVAQGTYTDDNETPKSKRSWIYNPDSWMYNFAVTLRPGVAVYGGFAGVETARDQRSTDNTLTVIDAQGSLRGIRAYASSLVVGVTIANGQTSNNSYEFGAGMFGGVATNCAFINNRATRGGGALYKGIATSCTFRGNRAEKGAGMSGGVARNCLFERNQASGVLAEGGGMFEGMAVACTFRENSVHGTRAEGGGMSGGLAMDCKFVGNFSAHNGGGMYKGEATGCTFVGNTSLRHGGGLFEGTAMRCTFTGNEATGPRARGGGMFGGSATNSTFTGNSAYWGGGVFSGGGTLNSYGLFDPSDSLPSITNCTFAANSATFSGGICIRGVSPAISRCVFWDNGQSISGAADITFSNIQGGWTGEGNINADPLFVEAPGPGPDGEWGTADDLGDLRLHPESPCIDAAGPGDSPSVDLAGTLRPQGNAIDMGAYEFLTD